MGSIPPASPEPAPKAPIPFTAQAEHLAYKNRRFILRKFEVYRALVSVVLGLLSHLPHPSPSR